MYFYVRTMPTLVSHALQVIIKLRQMYTHKQIIIMQLHRATSYASNTSSSLKEFIKANEHVDCRLTCNLAVFYKLLMITHNAN